MKIFVYGTLMKGLLRDEALSTSILLGTGSIEGKLYNLGSYPGLRAGNDRVFGELYEINTPILEYLDQIEGYRADQHCNSLYVRKKTIVSMDAHANNHHAETYFYNLAVNETSRIVTGDYRAFLGWFLP